MAICLRTLPRELRDKIWLLALLPQPGVYKFDPARFTVSPGNDGWEDERWMIPKCRYPTVMHLSQESRRFALKIKAQEEKEKEHYVPYYCVGESVRPFNPPTDTFWFSKESLLHHDWVTNFTSVIGCRLHTIENLSISPECFTPTVPTPGTNLPSRWNSFRWNRLLRITRLRRVDVILVVGSADGDRDVNKIDGSSIDCGIANELRLEKWTVGSSNETQDEVDLLMENVRSSTVKAFKDLYERVLEGDAEEETLLPLPEGWKPKWHDGSRITFHASKVLEYAL
jgi:hypothetical protein